MLPIVLQIIRRENLRLKVVQTIYRKEYLCYIQTVLPTGESMRKKCTKMKFTTWIYSGLLAIFIR